MLPPEEPTYFLHFLENDAILYMYYIKEAKFMIKDYSKTFYKMLEDVDFRRKVCAKFRLNDPFTESDTLQTVARKGRLNDAFYLIANGSFQNKKSVFRKLNRLSFLLESKQNDLIDKEKIILNVTKPFAKDKIDYKFMLVFFYLVLLTLGNSKNEYDFKAVLYVYNEIENVIERYNLDKW